MRIHYPLENCGLFYYDGPVAHALPLEGVHVAARIVDTVAEVQVVQFYVNNRPHTIDTRYQFPLDESAAVCGFEAELEDKLLIGEVREKEEARAEYHAALARGETAALLEQDQPNVFTQRIGNIKPYSRVNIRITYVADLKVESDGGVRFVLPTSVAPRYSPYWQPPGVRGGDYVVVPWRRHWRHCCLGRRVLYRQQYLRCLEPGYDYDLLPWYSWRYYTPEHVVNAEQPCAFSLTVEVEMPSRVTNITSSTHTVRWDPDGSAEGQSASVSLWSDTAPMGKDLVLSIYQHAAHAPHVELEVAPDGSGCAMLTMVPEFDIDPEPTEIVFLVDVSGSMRGDRLAAAVRALQLFLRSLPMTCWFNIYAFQSSFTTLFKTNGSEAYSKATLQRALDFVRNSLRAYGGTELLPPLRDIFRRPVACGHSRQLFVLTDGQVSNTADVIELCRQNAHNTRVFTVGIGEEVDRHLVEGMARAGTGTAEFIQGSELKGASGVLEGKLINQLKNATLPSITKIIVDWGELGAVTPPDFFNESSPSSSSSVQPSAPPAPTVDASLMCLATFRVKCEQTEKDEELYVVGSAEQLGVWDPSKATKLYTNAHAFPIWATSVALPNGSVSFKFIKKRPDGYVAFETVDNRTVTIVGTECTVECGAWNATTAPQLTNIVGADSAPAPTPAPAATITAPVAQPPVHHVGPAPVSKFFQTGPAQQRPGIMSFVSAGGRTPVGGGSIHAVGSGFGMHAATTLAPAVGYGHDASAAQAHGRNQDVYQAPFLPSPVFSGAKFVMYALFAPGRLPTGNVRISAAAPGGELVIDVPVTKLSTVGKTLHVLAARALVRDLDEGTSHLHWRQTGTPPSQRGGGDGTPRWYCGWLGRHYGGVAPVGGAGQDRGSAWNLEPVTPPAAAVRAEMIDLGVRFGIVSTFTSFVAVERWRDGRSGSSDIALPLPSQATSVVHEDRQSSSSFGRGGGGGGGGRGGLMAASAVQQQQQTSVFSGLKKKSMRSRAQPEREKKADGGARLFGYAAESKSSAASQPFAPSLSSAGYPSAPSGPPGYPSAPSFASAGPPPCMPSLSSAGPPGGYPSAQFLSQPLGALSRASMAMDECLAEPAFSGYSSEECDDESDLYSAPTASKRASSPRSSVRTSFPDELVAEQDFDGSFPATAALARCLGTSVDALQAGARGKKARLGSADDSTAVVVWTSIVVVAALAKHWPSFESSWQMVAEKTRGWLLAQLQRLLGVDRAAARTALEQLIADATSAC